MMIKSSFGMTQLVQHTGTTFLDIGSRDRCRYLFNRSYKASAYQQFISGGATTIQYANSDVESYLSGGTGVTFSSGAISIGQAVATSSNVTFADVAATGNLTVTGNLDVNGTTTTLDTTNSTIADRLIELGNGTSGTLVFESR